MGSRKVIHRHREVREEMVERVTKDKFTGGAKP
jgi:hypothetical protein